MEKYGVYENSPEDAEVASPIGHEQCPNCNSPLQDTENTGVKLCPNCGSRPFEEGK